MSQFVVAFDPGKLTGVSYADVNMEDGIITPLRTAETDFTATVDFLDMILLTRAQEDCLAVVAENFIITARTAKLTSQPFSLWVIGALRTVMYQHDYDPDELVLQKPSAAKNLIDNQMIKDAGLWHKGGAGHANDASRHALTYLLTNGWKPK